jgi:endonuclease VIII-like 1
MPELAEIKIMADYINDVCKKKDFTSIAVSESAASRKLSITQPSDLQVFKITAEARGKELMLTLDAGAQCSIKISCSMGMSGYWHFGNTEVRPKHAHLVFSTLFGRENLCLVDVRRFAKWKVVTDWNSNRGPCPLTQFADFKENLFTNLHRAEFNKPIHLVLMNQKYFGGIGNYLRAEILFHAKQNPFSDARTAINENPSILELCNQLPAEAYVLGGGQLKDWKNPFKIPDGGFDEWMKCYGKSNSIIDKNGRRFWYNPEVY